MLLSPSKSSVESDRSVSTRARTTSVARRASPPRMTSDEAIDLYRLEVRSSRRRADGGRCGEDAPSRDGLPSFERVPVTVSSVILASSTKTSGG